VGFVLTVEARLRQELRNYIHGSTATIPTSGRFGHICTQRSSTVARTSLCERDRG
jgi:hypothetical protein